MYFTSIMATPGRPPTKKAPPFGQRMAALRKRSGLTQVELAERLGLTQKAVDYYERRAPKPSIELLLNLADVFHVTTDELLGLNGTTGAIAKKHGPASDLEQKLEQVKQLPKSQQKTVLAMLSGLVEQGGTSL